MIVVAIVGILAVLAGFCILALALSSAASAADKLLGDGVLHPDSEEYDNWPQNF